MNFVTLLVSMGLMAVACSSPICRPDCELTDENPQTDFRHVSELQNSSFAPWTLVEDCMDGREPYHIQKAECRGGCDMQNMESKPIILEISVYEKIINSLKYCKCPFQLAVGCTCVSKTTATE